MDILVQYLNEVIDAAAEGNRDYCLGLETVGDDSRWAQLSWDLLNFAYPFSEPPLELLRRKGIIPPKDVSLEEWQAGRYVTFGHGVDPLPELAMFIRNYLEQILGLALTPGAYALLRP